MANVVKKADILKNRAIDVPDNNSNRPNNDFFDSSMRLGVYNIDTVIKLLETIQERSNAFVISPAEFKMALDQSVKLLLAKLYVERNCNTDPNPVVRILCDMCVNDVFVRKSKQRNYECPYCSYSCCDTAQITKQD